MSDQLITLKLSDKLYERIQEMAEADEQTVEAFVLEGIETLFDPENILSELVHYSDKRLWDVVYRQLPLSQSVRLHELSGQSSLKPGEQAEIEKLLELNDQFMLLRSEALLLLQQRGYNVDRFFNPVV